MTKPSVFISYSHKDAEWKEKLVTHLGVLQEQGLLEIWEDRQIDGGDDWLPEIEKAINKAHIAVLMISANFLTSKFILGKEVPELLKRREKDNLRIMPLIVKPCTWDTVDWLNQIQACSKDGKPLTGGNDFQIDSDLTAFAKEIQKLLKRVPKQTPITTDDEQTLIPPRKIETSKLPVINPTLYGRETELEMLDKAWKNPQTKILSFIAWGGVGKSALINGWLNKMGDLNYKEAELVYGWSFYSQGTKQKGQASSDRFFSDAFKWFGYTGKISKTQHEKGRLLAEIISEQKTLLILDGLESLQYPPGEMHGFLKDKTMSGFLKNLVRNMNGLCIITSRCKVEDLQATEGRLNLTQELENLSEQAGKAVLKSYRLKGTDKEFIETSNEFKGHALALHLVGSSLNAFHDGDIKQRNFIPKLTEDEKQGGHARRVMESYEKWFAETNKAELDVLNLLGLFVRPAVKEAVDVLKKEPAIKGLTDRLQRLSNKDWQLTLNHLRELRLVAEKDEHNPDTLDCHPLIREHFGGKLEQQNPDGWKEAHARLYDYYKDLPEKELPDTLEEMEPLFAAVMHCCLAGRYIEAFFVTWWNRIQRGKKHYCTSILYAYDSSLVCLASFFEIPWQKLIPGLPEELEAHILCNVGFDLRALGRLQEAVPIVERGLAMHIDMKNWRESAGEAKNLSELLLILGYVKEAENYSKQCVTFSDYAEDSAKKEFGISTLAYVHHQAGRTKEAMKLFMQAENTINQTGNIFNKRLNTRFYLFSMIGFRYCELLISLGKHDEVMKRAKQNMKFAKIDHNKVCFGTLEIALANLSLGIVFMNKKSPAKLLHFSKATTYLNRALKGLRKYANLDFIPWGLFARATLFRYKKQYLKSWIDLDEVLEIAEYSKMRLHLTDYFLESCRNMRSQLSDISQKSSSNSYHIVENGEDLSLSKKEMEAKFMENLKKAEKLINETGYHRRDGELEIFVEMAGEIR